MAFERDAPEPQGWIFDIQRFSTHDGPGIRTTVFFKGCGLRCAWCHNPESWSAGPQMQVYDELCIGCGRCVAACESGARSGPAKAFVRTVCRACGRCVDVCPSEGLVLSGRLATAREVVAEVLRDTPFYKTSGGGVTLSGGEPLLQPDFAGIILESCAREGVHTAVETAGHAPWSAFERIVPFTQLFLYDLKLMNARRHKEATGRDNDLILKNARRLGALGIPIVVRMPVIPDVNDAAGDVREVARFAASLPSVRALELMPFHGLASLKAASLGLENWSEGKSAPSAEALSRLVEVGTAEGLETRLG